ncbi:MAG: universal stress protein, partial [Terriglobales bacterium]
MNSELQAQESTHRVAIKNILVLTDFSQRSEIALAFAAQWAQQWGAMIHVAHFIRPSSYAMAWEAYGPVMERVWEESRTGLAALDAAPVLAGIRHATYLEPGEIGDGLSPLMRSENIDLVVLASTAGKGLAKALLGSTAEHVFRSVSCPVLMLGPSSLPPAPGRMPRRLLIATDFGPAEAHATGFAFSLAREVQARVDLLHVLSLPEGEPAPCTGEVERTERRLRALIPAGTESCCEPQAIVRIGRPDEEIVEAAHD